MPPNCTLKSGSFYGMQIHLNFENGHLIGLGWQAHTFSLSMVDSHQPPPDNVRHRRVC